MKEPYGVCNQNSSSPPCISQTHCAIVFDSCEWRFREKVSLKLYELLLYFQHHPIYCATFMHRHDRGVHCEGANDLA